MPYSKEHKQHTRQKILRAAGPLFLAQGFEATSIEAVMQACGLTRGGFYAHFASKAQLYREAMDKPTHDAIRPAAHGEEDAGEDWLEALLQDSLQGLGSGASDAGQWAFLATDAASTQREVRQAYSEAVRRMGERLKVDLGKAAHDNATGLVTLAMLVGAMAIAKTVDNQRLKTTLIEACRNAAMDLRQDDTVITRPVYFWTPDETQQAARCP